MRGEKRRVEVQFTQCEKALTPNRKTLGLKMSQRLITCLIKLIISIKGENYTLSLREFLEL